ncbi:MAG: phosphoadenylyl-sulfate reductase [Ilumatobacteraceae bacterium]
MTALPDLPTLDLDALNAEFEAHGDAGRMVQWLVDLMPVDRLVVASAMTSDTVLVDVVAKVAPGIEVLFLDTGYHFPETIQTLERVGTKYPVRLKVTPAPPLTGERTYLSDPDGCCHLRKVVPLEEGLAGNLGWISGVRRSDSAVRAETPFVQIDKRGLIKLNPLAAWTDADLATYAAIHEVPLNPLLDQGYPSIGCWPCTRQPVDGEDARAGRWSDHAKTECGLHV